jgi:hypothetical protein
LEDIVVRLMDLPYSIRGFVVESPDGFYNVYLNARYCYDQNTLTMVHELKHIRNGDLNSILSAHEIERSLKDGNKKIS